MYNLRQVLAAFLTIIIGTGCYATQRVITEPLPLPGEPALPTVLEREVSCLNEATWRKIVLRDTIRMRHIAELRAIITATHQTSP